MINVPVHKLTKRDYGAFELKQFINTATQRGFLATVALILLLFLLQFAVKTISNRQVSMAPPITKITLDDIPAQTDEVPDVPPPPPPPDVVFTGAEARAGTPVAIPDAEMAPDMRDFANLDELAVSSSSNDAVVNMDNFSKVDVNKPIQVVKESEPDPDEFVSVDEEIDLNIVQREVAKYAQKNYPQVALRANLEGNATLRVLIGTDGRPKRTITLESSSDIFEKAAIESVMKIVVPPAKQAKKPIDYWITIPVVFRLN